MGDIKDGLYRFSLGMSSHQISEPSSFMLCNKAELDEALWHDHLRHSHTYVVNQVHTNINKIVKSNSCLELCIAC